MSETPPHGGGPPADGDGPADRSNASQRAEELRAQIAHHDQRYYLEDSPEISDADYDALVRQLRAIEDEHSGLVTPDSPTQRVGGARAVLLRRWHTGCR